MNRYSFNISIEGRPRHKKRRKKKVDIMENGPPSEFSVQEDDPKQGSPTDPIDQEQNKKQQKQKDSSVRAENEKKELNSEGESSSDSENETEKKKALPKPRPLGPDDDREWPLSKEEEEEYVNSFVGASPEQRQVYLKFFKSADKENKGYISGLQFRDEIFRRGYRGTTMSIAKMFVALNTNSDLDLTIHEFMTEMCKEDSRKRSTEGWRDLFDSIDKNHDGYVDLDDLKRSCSERNMRILEIDQKGLLHRSDLDHDGKVSFDDFLHSHDFYRPKKK